jgi:hypothetical protein
MVQPNISMVDSLNLAPYLPILSEQLRTDLQKAHSDLNAGMVLLDNKPFVIGGK